uniref:Uncharacterized protein n=1 Tax=Oryza glumipatula TaxID=40148 RepID=A0A0D9ZTS9_9ORYZ
MEAAAAAEEKDVLAEQQCTYSCPLPGKKTTTACVGELASTSSSSATAQLGGWQIKLVRRTNSWPGKLPASRRAPGSLPSIINA